MKAGTKITGILVLSLAINFIFCYYSPGGRQYMEVANISQATGGLSPSTPLAFITVEMPGCGPCKANAGIMSQYLSGGTPNGVAFYKINAISNMQELRGLGISSAPVSLLYKRQANGSTALVNKKLGPFQSVYEVRSFIDVGLHA